MADQSYTLSFWARSDVTRTLDDGDRQTRPAWNQLRLSLRCFGHARMAALSSVGYATVTAGDGQLAFGVGEGVGELWLDEVQLQAGALGVWARPFENGLGGDQHHPGGSDGALARCLLQAPWQPGAPLPGAGGR